MRIVDVRKTYIDLKFDVSLSFSSVKNSAFSLFNTVLVEENPVRDGVPITNPFKPILAEHYQSLSRTLRLYFNPDYFQIGAVSATYELEANLKDSSGVSFTSVRQFEYQFSDGEETPYEEDASIQIIDHTTSSLPWSSNETIRAANPNFYIVSTDPENGSIFVEEDLHRGRITIKFSSRPSPRFLNSKFIKVQKKEIARIGSRWERLPIRISMDSYYPWIYVYVPSVEEEGEESVYNTEDRIYYETGYKYRVRVLGEVGT